MKSKFINGIVLLVLVFIVNYIASNVTGVLFGKDNGLVFRIVSTSLVSAILFFINKRSIMFFLLGLITGIGSFTLVLLLVIIISNLIQSDLNGWELPFIYVQIMASVLIFIILQFSLNKMTKKS